jgi:hypothetical protein
VQCWEQSEGELTSWFPGRCLGCQEPGRRVFHSILDELTDGPFDQYLINIHQWQFRVDIDAQLMGGEAMRALPDRGSEDIGWIGPHPDAA